MPIHLDSISAMADPGALLPSLLQAVVDKADAVIFSEDGQCIHIARFLEDLRSGDRIGKLVATVLQDESEGSLRILDLDMTLDSEAAAELRFLRKLPGSSDANEYYDVETPGLGQRLQVETVDRCQIRQELEGTVLPVGVSAFPFQLSVYADMDELNRAMGFQPREGEGQARELGGFAADFAAPGGSWGADGDGEAYSILAGTVRSVRDVEVRLGEETFSFALAQVDSALGLLPTAIGRDVFSVEELAPGRVIFMSADIKADLAADT